MTPRSALAFVLSLLLLVTATAFGAARGHARVAGEVVLCIGGAAVTMAVDENGEPIGAVHVCPDCALSTLAAVAMASVSHAVPSGVRPLVLSFGSEDQRTPLWRPNNSARGPPSQIV